MFPFGSPVLTGQKHTGKDALKVSVALFCVLRLYL